METLNWSLVVDLLLALIIIWKLVQGRRDGVVKRLGRLAALAGALLAGGYVKRSFAEQVSERWLEPGILKLLTHARESMGLEDLLVNLARILDKANLPGFLKVNVPERVAALGSEADSVVEKAAKVVSLRLSEWLLFLVAAILAYAIIRICFDGILDPVIRKLPIVGSLNGLLGALLGAALGVVMAVFLLWLAFHLIPALSAPGRPLSPEGVERTYLTKFVFQQLPNLFIRG